MLETSTSSTPLTLLSIFEFSTIFYNVHLTDALHIPAIR